MTTMPFTKHWVGTMRRLGLAQKLVIAVGTLLLFGAHASSALAGGKGLDIGPLVVTVQVDSVKTEHNADWFGPYYHIHYRLSSTGATTAQGSLYVAQGCTDCWISAYAFGDYADIDLSLTDDQWPSGHQPVNINGVYANDHFKVSPKDCTVSSLASLVPVSSTDACQTYTFTSTGSRTSGVDRTATVTGKIIVRTALQHQAAMRRQVYETYIDVLEGIPLSGQICTDRWKAANADWERELVGLILTGFGLASLPTGTVESIIEYILGELGTAIVEYLTGSREYAEAAPNYKFNPPDNLWLCGNFSTLWVDSNVNGPGGRLRASLNDLRAKIGALLELLQTSSATRATVATHFTGQKDVVNQAAQEAQHLLNVLNNYASMGGNDVCMHDPGCRITASHLLDIVNPIMLEMQKDSAYIAATLALLTAVPPDTTPPTVAITAPAAGATVAATVTVSASATDNVGVVGVQFRLDGVNLGAKVTVAPYAISWNTTGAPDGSHILTAVARDAAGNASTSTARTVTVNNDLSAPVLSMVAASNISSSGATITWTTNEASDSQVEYGPTSGYGQVTVLASALVTSHSVGLSGLSASTLYHYRVKSRDAAGNLAVSADVTFTTAAPPVTRSLLDLPAFGGIRTGPSPTTLTIYSSGQVVEWALWHGSAYQQGVVAENATKDVTIPSSKAFVLEIARPYAGKVAWLFGREGRGQLAYKTLVGGPAGAPVVDVAGLGGIKKGSSANTLSVYSSGQYVEHQMWHGSTTQQGGVPVGGTADVAVPHYKSFMFTIARPSAGKTAWVFGRENDGLLVVATLSGTSTASTLVDVPGLGGLRLGSNANTLTVYSSGPGVEWALWHGATYQQGTVAGGGTAGVTIPHWKSFVLTIAQPDIGKTAWVFGRENDRQLAYAVLK